MNILITGGAGGIGSTLASYLANFHNIIVYDNFNNGYIENLIQDKNIICDLVVGDIRDTNKLIKVLNTNNITHVIHLAAISSLPECEKNPTLCMDVNVNGTISVLDACRKQNIHKIIVASSSSVYENNNLLETPFKEDIIINPRLFYPLSKKITEDVSSSFIKNYNMKITMLRFFNVFGPRQDVYRKSPPLLNYIVKQVKANENCIFYSNGNQVRDYIDVNDVIKMINMCLYSDKTDNQIFNVCTETLTSVNDIISYAEEAFNIFLNYEFKNSDFFWDDYSLGIDKKVLIDEVNKFSLGSLEKTKLYFNWIPDKNIKPLMIKALQDNYNRI